MDNDVIISVIVPIYNAERHLDECIRSILNQAFTHLELILINDGSTDSSGEICDRYSLIDKRIKVINKTNGGVSSARNEGINVASGKYISFIDADDTIDNNYFEKLISAALEEDYDIAICGYKILLKLPNNKQTIRYQYCYDFAGSISEFLSDIPKYISNTIIQGPCCKLFKSKIIRDNNISFPLNMSFGEDTIFVYDFLLHTCNVVSIDECSYNYNQLEPNTLSTTYRDDKLDIYLHLYKNLDNLLNNYNINLGRGNKFFINHYICSAFVSCVRELCIAKPKLNKDYRLKQIEIMISHEEVRNAFNACKDSKIQTKLINSLIIKKNIKTIDLYFRLKELVRHNLNWIYKKISHLA